MRSVSIRELTFGFFNNFNTDTIHIDPALFVGFARHY